MGRLSIGMKPVHRRRPRRIILILIIVISYYRIHIIALFGGASLLSCFFVVFVLTKTRFGTIWCRFEPPRNHPRCWMALQTASVSGWGANATNVRNELQCVLTVWLSTTTTSVNPVILCLPNGRNSTWRRYCVDIDGHAPPNQAFLVLWWTMPVL